MSQPQITSSLDDLVTAMTEWAGQGALMIDHMSRWAERSGNPRPVIDRLHEILTGTLRPLLDRHAAADVRATAAVLADAVETIGEEVYLIPPGEFD